MTDQPPGSASAAPLDEYLDFRRSTVFCINHMDEESEQLEERVTALEEVFAARWPRSVLLRWRLGRRLRQSVAPYKWVGPRFREQRWEAVSDIVHFAPLERRPLTDEEIDAKFGKK